MKNWRLITSMLILLCLLIGCASTKENTNSTDTRESTFSPQEVSSEQSSISESSIEEEIPSFTSSMLIKELGAGWNLGNALDAYSSKATYTFDTEQLNGNPYTTKDMIDKVKEAGFQSIRIPITYSNHMDENATIDVKWLQRVKEVVDYAVSDGMYCIINIHHDTGEKGWLRADLASLAENKTKLSSMWTQIGQYFSEYDDHLLFEGYNEILNSENKWSYAGADSYQAANELNQTFVDSIRSLGGNNATRFLIVNTYAGSSEQEVISNFVLPKDTTIDRLIVGVHSYVDTNGLTTLFSNLNQTFITKKIPVILSEFAMPRSKALEERVTYAQTVVQYAKQYNIGYFWWDDGNYDSNTKLTEISDYGLLNRNILQWAYPEIVDALVK